MAMERVDRAEAAAARQAAVMTSKQSRARMWQTWLTMRGAMLHALFIAALTALILLVMRPAFIYAVEDDFGVPQISMARVTALSGAAFLIATVVLFRGR